MFTGSWHTQYTVSSCDSLPSNADLFFYNHEQARQSDTHSYVDPVKPQRELKLI